MIESESALGNDKHVQFFMDLLSHDILNNNQAVLSYLELVLASPDLRAKTRAYAEKAVSHVRTSSALVENAKNLMMVMSADPGARKPVDLMKSMDLAVRELPRFFPSRRIRTRLVPGPEKAYVLGHAFTQDLVLKVFLDLARADPGEEVDIEARIVKSEHEGKMCWSLVLSDKNALLQPGMRIESLPALYSQDSSRMAKMSGYVFARIAAQMLGGRFEAKESADGTGRGGQFALTLLKAGEP